MACVTLDVRGQLCPMPVIKTQQAVKSLVAGDELIVLASDPGTEYDIPAFCDIFQLHCQPVIRLEDGDLEFHISL